MGMRLRTINSISGSVTASSDLSAIGGKKYSWQELTARTHECCFPVGFDKEGLTVANFDAHTLVCGQTGSGKTLSALANTILLNASSSDTPSLVIIDAKTSLHSLTVQRLESLGYTVRHVNLLTDSPDSFNPLQPIKEMIERGQEAVADLLLDSLLESLQAGVKKDTDVFWQNTASTLISGCTYGLIEALGKRAEPTLGMMSDLVAKGVPGLLEFRKTLRGKNAQRAIDNALASAPAKETMAGVLSVTETALSFFASATGRSVTGKSTFDIEECLFGGNPTAVYITCPEAAGPGAKQIATIFFNTLYTLFARRAEDNAMRGFTGRKIMVIWDEFSAFPRSMVPQMLAMSRSRGMCAMIGMQSTAQLISSGYTTAESETMLGQFGKALLFRSTDSLINKVAAERTAGLIGTGGLADLQPGEALATFAGMPVVRTSLPLFDNLVERCGFHNQDKNQPNRPLWLDAQETAALSPAASTREAINSVRYAFARLAMEPKIPNEAETIWAKKFVQQAEKSNTYSDISSRIEQIGQHGKPLPLADWRLCGCVLALHLNDLASNSSAEAQLICRKLGDGTFPFMPQLGDTLYQTALDILFASEESFARKDTQALIETMLSCLEEPCKAAVANVSPWQLEAYLPVGWALQEYKRKIDEGDVDAWQADVLNELMSSLSNTPRYMLMRCIGQYKSMAEGGSRVGSLLFEDSHDSRELKLWVAAAGSLGQLFYSEACSQLRTCLMDSMENPPLALER